MGTFVWDLQEVVLQPSALMVVLMFFIILAYREGGSRGSSPTEHEE